MNRVLNRSLRRKASAASATKTPRTSAQEEKLTEDDALVPPEKKASKEPSDTAMDPIAIVDKPVDIAATFWSTMEEDADAGNTLLGDELPLLDTKTVLIETGYKPSTK